MPSLVPFRGLRYDPARVGLLSQLIAPPWDTISPQLQSSLHRRHPANAIRLEFGRGEPGDDERQNPWSRAARFLEDWRDQGVLVQDPAAAIYVCHQEFELEGETFLRRGFMARVRLERFGTGNIHPHAATDPDRTRDRLSLLRACRLNTSPVVALYPDDLAAVQSFLDQAVSGQPPIELVDDSRVCHRIWAVADQTIAARVAGLIGPRPLSIAAGHHRYQAACDYRDEVAAAWPLDHGGQTLPADHPARFVLMMLVEANDTGLLPSADLLEAIHHAGESGSLAAAGTTSLIPPVPAGLVFSLAE